MIVIRVIFILFWLIVTLTEINPVKSQNNVMVTLQVTDEYTSLPVDGAAVTMLFDGTVHGTTETNNSGVATFSMIATSIADEAGIPATFELSNNYPNPFESETRVDFAIPDHTQITAGVYNVLGQRVLTQSFFIDPGAHSLSIPMGNLPPGMYFLRITGSGIQPQIITMTKQGTPSITVPLSMSLTAASQGTMLSVQKTAPPGYTFLVEHPRFEMRQFTTPITTDTTINITTNRLNQVVFKVADEEQQEMEMSLRLTAPLVHLYVTTPDTMILRSGQYNVYSQGHFSSEIDELIEIASVDTTITLQVETVETMAFEVPPNDEGLLFAVKHISGHTGYFYGLIEDERMDITHLVIDEEDQDPIVIFYDENYYPIHIMFGDLTIAVMRSDRAKQNAGASSSNEAIHIMNCSEGETSLTFGMDTEDMLSDLLDIIVSVMDSDAAKKMENVRVFIQSQDWGDMSLSDLVDLARSEVEKRLPHNQLAASLSTSAVLKRLIDKFNIPGPAGGALKQMIDYMQRIGDGYYDGSDIEGPQVGMLLCRGQSIVPGECNRFFLYNKPGNITKCVQRCIVTLSCFTDICHPMPLSVADVMSYRANH